VGNILPDRDRDTLERAAGLQALHGADQVRQWAGAQSYDISATLAAYVELAGACQALLGDLAAIIGRLDDAGDEDYNCAVCGALIGIFIDHGQGWHHYRGEGTAASPVELFDAGHEATPGKDDSTWLP
jgi:hypothetical protein